MFLYRIHGLQESYWQQQPGPSSVFGARFVIIVFFLKVAFKSGFQLALFYIRQLLGEKQTDR